jgi:hypothetical protein
MSSSTKATDRANLSEAEFLRLQAEQARAAAGRAIKDARLALVGKLDPREFTRKHPWLAILSATAAGFTAAAVAVPSKEEQELRRIERLQRAMHPPAPAPMPATNGKTEEPKAAPPHSIWSTILHELILLIKPILLAGITAGVKSATTRSRNGDPT